MKEKILQAIEERNLYDFLTSELHNLSKEELMVLVQEFDFAVFHLSKFEYTSSLYEKVCNTVYNEFKERHIE